MAYNTTASTATDPDLINQQGVIITARLAGSLRDVTWEDFGYVYDFEAADDIQKVELYGNRDGTKVKVKSDIDQFARAINFGTVSITDTIRGWHSGSTLATSAVSGMDGVKIGEVSAASAEVEMIVLRKNKSGNHLLFYYPSVSLAGNGETLQEQYTQLNFTGELLSKDSFTMPSSIIAGAEPMPYGFYAIVPQAKLAAVLSAINDIAPSS